MPLVGCSRGKADPSSVTRISIWSMWTGGEEKNFQAVLDRYHELHPNIIVENLGAVTDDTKTIRAIVAGVPPDLFTLSDALFLGPLAANGALSPMDDLFRASGLREETFVPASLRLCRSQGHLYAMPFLIDDNALMWNKKAFREAGLDPERPPRTLEELEEYAVKLTKMENGQITQLGLQPLNDENTITPLFGGSLYDEKTGQVTPDSPSNIAAMEWYVGLVEKMGGYAKVNSFAAGFGPMQGASNPFFTGRVAMKFDGEWNPSWCKKYAPGLEYGVAPSPALAAHPERGRSTWFGGNMLCIPKGSKHPKEAWDLLMWMQTDEAQVLFASKMNNVPNSRSALKSPALRVGDDYKVKFGKFLDLADSPNAGNFPPLPVAGLYNAELAAARDLILSGEKKPAQALRDVRVRVQRELDRYK